MALLLGLFALAGTGVPALAHTRSETHSNWQITGSTVRLSFTVPDTEAKRLAPPGRAMPSAAQLGGYLRAHIWVHAGKDDCRLLGAPDPTAAIQGVQRVEFTFQCPDVKAIRIHSSAFFELVPTHTNFAQIQTDAGDFIEQLITQDNQTLDVSEGAGNELKNASFVKYIELGVLHIFTA